MPSNPSRYSSAPPTSRECPFGECGGDGLLVDEASNTTRPCRCRDTRVAEALGQRLEGAIPERFRGVSFDRKPICDLDPLVLRHVRGFINRIDDDLDRGKGLWFYGDVGTGKTSLAMLVARAARKTGRSVAIYSVPLLLATIRQTYEADSGASYTELFRRLSAVDLLLLDDLGSEKPTDWAREQLFSLVNERWQDKASLVVTTSAPEPRFEPALELLGEQIIELQQLIKVGPRPDLTPMVARLERTTERLEKLASLRDADCIPYLRRQLGPRTVSRLIEICEGPPIPIMGPDLRTTAGAA